MEPRVLYPLVFIYILSFSFSCQHWLFLFCSSASPLCKVTVHLHFLFGLWCNVGKTPLWSDFILLVWCQIAIKNSHTFSAVALKGRTADVALYFAIVAASLFPLLPIKGCVGVLLQGLCRKGDILLADGFVGRRRLGSRRPERPSGLFVDSNTSKDPSKILHHVKKKSCFFKNFN